MFSELIEGSSITFFNKTTKNCDLSFADKNSEECCKIITILSRLFLILNLESFCGCARKVAYANRNAGEFTPSRICLADSGMLSVLSVIVEVVLCFKLGVFLN